MSNVRRSNEEIRVAKGRLDLAQIRAATETDIERWKDQDGVEDAALGPVCVVGPGPDVRLREGLSLSLEDFTERFHLSLRTIQEWEQRRRVPEGPALTLLRVIERDPLGVKRALAGLSVR